jgi:hypothetical protein
MTDRHDHKRREPRLPPELALIADRLECANTSLPPAHLRGRVLGAVIDALHTDDPAEADLLPPPRDEPWPAAVALLTGLVLALLVTPLLDTRTKPVATPPPRLTERMAAMGIPLPAASSRYDSEKPPAGDRVGHIQAERRAAAASIAALRSLPPNHWLKGAP